MVLSSSGVCKHLEVLRSTGEVVRSVWEDSMLLPDQFTFCWCSWDWWETFREASAIWIAAMGKNLGFQHRCRHRHILDYMRIHHWGTSYERHFHFVWWLGANIGVAPILIQMETDSFQHSHILKYMIIRHCTTACKYLPLNGKRWRNYSFNCRPEINITMVKHLQFSVVARSGTTGQGCNGEHIMRPGQCNFISTAYQVFDSHW